ncbi:large subunit ribosomal protein L18Ae [Nematocida displodere]|uniref:60S ribosomal protein L20 n=1 Tax=Nematocida displodere TaxID=1805483 RepID=A0A177EBA4_9MICR|nr:large subunit ribosomal protein L18Ae [Nematocida displodere]
MQLREFNTFVSEKPSETNASPQIYICNVFAKNEILAKSKAFSLLRKTHKIKSTSAVVLKLEEVAQYADVKARTFGVSAVYRSTAGLHNVHKEIRAVTRAGAVGKIYQDLRSRHSAKQECVTIIDVKEIAECDVVSKDLAQVINAPKYPLFDKRVPATAPNYQAVSIARK